MKYFYFKILIMIFTLVFLFSCEIIEEEKKITVNAKPFAAGVVRVHVAVLDGEDVLSKKVYERDDVNEDGSIEIYTTPGSNRTFVVLAEDDQGYASHFAHDTVNIDTDGKAVVELEMKQAVWELYTIDPDYMNMDHDSDNFILSWDSAGIIKTEYIIKYYNSENIRYKGFKNSLYPINNDYNLSLEVKFYPFDLTTRKFSVNIAV